MTRLQRLRRQMENAGSDLIVLAPAPQFCVDARCAIALFALLEIARISSVNVSYRAAWAARSGVVRHQA